MKITLKNYEIAPAIEFLQEIELKATDSRHRTKLVKLLMQALEGLQESQQELINRYGKKDEEGKLIQSDDGKNYDLEPFTSQEYAKEIQQLSNEEIVIEGGIYVKNIEALSKILSSYEGEISGKDADVYDRLMDEFEKDDK